MVVLVLLLCVMPCCGDGDDGDGDGDDDVVATAKWFEDGDVFMYMNGMYTHICYSALTMLRRNNTSRTPAHETSNA